MNGPLTEDRPLVPRWVYLAEAGLPLDGPPVTMPGAQAAGLPARPVMPAPGRARRLDLILLLALIAAVILGLCVVLGTDPARV